MYSRIKDLREDRDLLQTDVAKILGTSQQQYTKLETGQSDISGKKLIKLAKFYKVSADFILGLTDNPKPYDA